MYLHFEDWTSPLFLSVLDRNGIPHGERIIKIYATERNPHTLIDKPNLTVIESSSEPFREDEFFDYGERGTLSGKQLKNDLDSFGLTEDGKTRVRAFFRFSNTPELGFTQAAMAAKKSDGSWLIDHPFQDIDKLKEAGQKPERFNPQMHLEIFFPESLQRLKSIVDYDDPSRVIHFLNERNLGKELMQPSQTPDIQRRKIEG